MPRLRNRTPFAAELVPMIDVSGRNVVVVIVKATYALTPDGDLTPSAVQEPIAYVDVPHGNPENKEIREPSDLVDYKPAVDILILRPTAEADEKRLRGRQVSVAIGSLKITGKVTDVWPFGPVRRDREPRKGFVGTYDDAWAEQRMPLLPEDFDPRYNQAALPAHTIPHLSGDEPIRLSNLYGESTSIHSRLPQKAVIIAGNVLSYYFTEVTVLDTVSIWSDAPRLTLVWRHVIRPRQKIEEVDRVHVYLARLRTARELYGVA